MTLLTRKLTAACVVAAACVALVTGGRALFGPGGRLAADRGIAARSKGDPKARVWIVEYLDFQCLACSQAGPLLREYMEKHPSEVYLQARFYPLIRTDHRYGVKSAIYADCAAVQGKFWPFHDLLFEKQAEWSASEDPDAVFHGYARGLGIDERRLSACVDDPAIKKQVLGEKAEAMDLGVRSTPTFFINGRMVVGLESLEDELREK
ncbi:MAG TPA: thioredoxin domain-containing protein [Candidatus Eisenbacteria bacterium]|nr:thioredoxin domain-containing protein [Candidatus Eisenbacteria bacterium]